eukprot:TRINITY_DN37823_c0_g1_i1.p1 TRINITY_DN37823_c0_g1~~TRINITY_DN37823_c0_g1_i1.p1  ORF type:complete len:277 (-),score=26.44 TRINITY_DN37823_c0_g1_i1:264-1094(-)
MIVSVVRNPELIVRKSLLKLRCHLRLAPQLFELVMSFAFDFEAALKHACQHGALGDVLELLDTKPDYPNMDDLLQQCLGASSEHGHLAVVVKLFDTLMDRIDASSIVSEAAPSVREELSGQPLLEKHAETLFGLDGAFHAAITSHAGPKFPLIGYILLEYSRRAARLYGLGIARIDIIPAEFIPESAFSWLLDLPEERGWYTHCLSCWPALHVATFFRLPTFVRELLDAGADPNQQCMHYTTPRCLASDNVAQPSTTFFQPAKCPEVLALIEKAAS